MSYSYTITLQGSNTAKDALQEEGWETLEEYSDNASFNATEFHYFYSEIEICKAIRDPITCKRYIFTEEKIKKDFRRLEFNWKSAARKLLDKSTDLASFISQLEDLADQTPLPWVEEFKTWWVKMTNNIDKYLKLRIVYQIKT
jgi:hypothetical protein